MTPRTLSTSKPMYNADGTLAVGATITFIPISQRGLHISVFTTEGESITVQPVVVTVDDTGNFTTQLFPTDILIPACYYKAIRVLLSGEEDIHIGSIPSGNTAYSWAEFCTVSALGNPMLNTPIAGENAIWTDSVTGIRYKWLVINGIFAQAQEGVDW